MKVLKEIKSMKFKNGQKITFFPTAPEKMVKNKEYFGFFIQKKKCTSEQFLEGCHREPPPTSYNLILSRFHSFIIYTNKMIPIPQEFLSF